MATDARLAEGQFLHEEQTLNKAKSLMYNSVTCRVYATKICLDSPDLTREFILTIADITTDVTHTFTFDSTQTRVL
jgi:hypothetical protein